MTTEDLLRAVGSTVRVHEDDKRLSDKQISELEDLFSQNRFGNQDSVLIAMITQSLVLSGRAKNTARLILRYLTGPHCQSTGSAARQTLRRSFDVCIYESFRQGEDLRFNRAENVLTEYMDQLTLLKQGSASSAWRPGGIDSTRIEGLHQTSQLASLLLNTEHQTAAARVLIEWFQYLRNSGNWSAPAGPLADLIRKCVSPTRTFFDLPALAELREEAQETARQWLYRHAPGTIQNTTSERALSFKFLLSSGDIHRQRRTLETLFEDAAEYQDSKLWDLATNCLSWILETTLDADLTNFGEQLFFDIKTPPYTHQYLAMAIRLGDRARGEWWIEANKTKTATFSSRYLEARFHLAFGSPELCLVAASKPLSVCSTFHSRRQPGKVERLVRRLSGRSLSGGISSIDPMILYNLARTAQEARFLRDLNIFVRKNSVSTAPQDNGRTLILAPNHLNFATQLPVAAIEKSRLLGTEIVCMVNGVYPSSDALTPAAQSLKDVIMPGFYYNRDNPTSALSAEWIIKPHEKKLIYKGTNYFHGVHNSLGIHYRRFTIDFDNSVENIQMRRNLVMIQGLHDAFEKFLLQAEDDRIYVFVAIGIQAGLGCALRTLVTNAARPNIRVVHASNGFETFDPAFAIDPIGGNAVASYHSVTDLTDHPNTPLGFRPSPDQCEDTVFTSEDEYRSINPSLDQYLTKVDGRANEAQAAFKKDAIDRRRVLVLGTILPDLSIPHDHGIAHEDIADWITHTVEVAEKHDLELIVKPHPAEINQKMGFYVSEKFADLFPKTQQVQILPYDSNFHEAVFSSDIVIIWSGTSVIELTLMGHPYVSCSRFANEEYPISVDQFSDRAEFEDLLVGKKPLQTNPGGRLKAIDVIHRITTSPLREPSVWPKRQLLNGHVWPPKLDPEAATEQLNDPSTDRLAHRLMCIDRASNQDEENQPSSVDLRRLRTA